MHGTSSTADSEYDVRSEVYRSIRSADIPREMCCDKLNHWPVFVDTPNSQRCKYEHCNKKNINAQNVRFSSVLQIIVISERSME